MRMEQLVEDRDHLKRRKEEDSVMEALTETGFVIASLSLIVELIDNPLQ